MLLNKLREAHIGIRSGRNLSVVKDGLYKGVQDGRSDVLNALLASDELKNVSRLRSVQIINTWHCVIDVYYPADVVHQVARWEILNPFLNEGHNLWLELRKSALWSLQVNEQIDDRVC